MGVQGLILARFCFCFVQYLMSTPDVKVIGGGGSVEADSVGIFYTHYTYNHTSRCYWSSVSLKSRDVISYEDS